MKKNKLCHHSNKISKVFWVVLRLIIITSSFIVHNAVAMEEKDSNKDNW